MFIRGKRIKGNTYYYLVKSERHGKKVTQKFIGYIGKTRVQNRVSLAGRAAQVRTPTGLEALAREALKYKSAKNFVKNMREGIVLGNRSLPDILRSPMAELIDARRSGTFQDIERTKEIVWENIIALNRELKGKPFAPLYRLNDAGKVVFTASDITTTPRGVYEPKFFGKKFSAIKPKEAKEFISKIKEQRKQHLIDPLVAEDKIQFLEEIWSGQTLTDFYNQVRRKMNAS